MILALVAAVAMNGWACHLETKDDLSVILEPMRKITVHGSILEDDFDGPWKIVSGSNSTVIAIRLDNKAPASISTLVLDTRTLKIIETTSQANSDAPVSYAHGQCVAL